MWVIVCVLCLIALADWVLALQFSGPHPLIRCCNVWKRKKSCVLVEKSKEEKPEGSGVHQSLLLWFLVSRFLVFCLGEFLHEKKFDLFALLWKSF